VIAALRSCTRIPAAEHGRPRVGPRSTQNSAPIGRPARSLSQGSSADLFRRRNKSAYSDHRVMPTQCDKALQTADFDRWKVDIIHDVRLASKTRRARFHWRRRTLRPWRADVSVSAAYAQPPLRPSVLDAPRADRVRRPCPTRFGRAATWSDYADLAMTKSRRTKDLDDGIGITRGSA
jgi:hypothetical protein